MCGIVDFISVFYSNLSDWRLFWGSKSQKTVSIQIRLQNLCTFCILGLEGSMDILEVCKMCGIVDFISAFYSNQNERGSSKRSKLQKNCFWLVFYTN